MCVYYDTATLKDPRHMSIYFLKHPPTYTPLSKLNKFTKRPQYSGYCVGAYRFRAEGLKKFQEDWSTATYRV